MIEDPEKKYPCGWKPNKNICKWCMHFTCPKNTNYASRPVENEETRELIECLKWNLNWLSASMMLENEEDQRMRLTTCKFLDELAQIKRIDIPVTLLREEKERS